MLKFLKDTATAYYTKLKFNIFYEKCDKIMDAIQLIELGRMAKITAIDLCYEREKRNMMEHYAKKAKKNKPAKKFLG